MAKGYRGASPMGGANMANMMKQAQRMQQQMLQMQADLEEKEYEASSGGGTVKAVITGKKQLKSVTIDPEAVDPEDVEMLQDMIIAAVNEAYKKAEEDINASMGKLTGGMNLGGLGGLL